MNFRSTADLNHTIIRNLSRVPRDVSLVVGIPRSGMLAANLIALYLNKPLTDLEGLLQRRTLHSGRRGRRSDSEGDAVYEGRILVVDDTVRHGTTMRETRRRITGAGFGDNILYSAIYASPAGRAAVDLYFEEVACPRVFEWNVMHSYVLRDSCLDIDGLLCNDPSSAENDDGARYAEFLCNAAPMWLPTVDVGWLVTCRLEKYRSATQQWLDRHGVRYRELIMLNVQDGAARRSLGVHAQFKADAYCAKDAQLFIESNHAQATEIARRSGRPVLCLSAGEVIFPRISALAKQSVVRLVKRAWRRIGRAGGRLVRRQFGVDPANGGMKCTTATMYRGPDDSADSNGAGAGGAGIGRVEHIDRTILEDEEPRGSTFGRRS